MTNKKTYLERQAMMVSPEAETGDGSLKDLVAGVANQAAYPSAQSAETELFSAKAAKQQETELEEETEGEGDEGDVEVEVEVEVEGENDMDEDEEVDCGEPGDEGYDECMAELEDEMMDDDDIDTRSAKADIYQPPQLMTEAQLSAKFSKG